MRHLSVAQAKGEAECLSATCAASVRAKRAASAIRAGNGLCTWSDVREIRRDCEPCGNGSRLIRGWLARGRCRMPNKRATTAKVRRQRPIKGHVRQRVSSSFTGALKRAADAEARRYRVSRSFVLAVAAAYALGVEVEAYDVRKSLRVIHGGKQRTG